MDAKGCAISLWQKVLTNLTKVVSFSILQRVREAPAIHLFGTCSHDCYFELPTVCGEAGCPLKRSATYWPATE